MTFKDLLLYYADHYQLVDKWGEDHTKASVPVRGMQGSGRRRITALRRA